MGFGGLVQFIMFVSDQVKEAEKRERLNRPREEFELWDMESLNQLEVEIVSMVELKQPVSNFSFLEGEVRNRLRLISENPGRYNNPDYEEKIKMKLFKLLWAIKDEYKRAKSRAA